MEASQQIVVLLLSAAMFCASTELSASAEGLMAGSNAPPRELSLKDVNGKAHRPLAEAGQRATVLFFVLHDCPLANRCAPEINRIASEYQKRGIRSFLVYVGDDLTPKAAHRHAQDYGLTLPALLDSDQQLVRFTGVTVSPEVAVLAPDNRQLYRGRIDDRLTALGKPRAMPSRRDLREALDAILEGRPVSEAVTKSVGCYLPVRPASKSAKDSP